MFHQLDDCMLNLLKPHALVSKVCSCQSMNMHHIQPWYSITFHVAPVAHISVCKFYILTFLPSYCLNSRQKYAWSDFSKTLVAWLQPRKSTEWLLSINCHCCPFLFISFDKVVTIMRNMLYAYGCPFVMMSFKTNQTLPISASKALQSKGMTKNRLMLFIMMILELVCISTFSSLLLL